MMSTGRGDELSKEYIETCGNFRSLTDIRFKLLALLPIGAIAGLIVAANKIEKGQWGIFELMISLFGLAITIGLITYNKRNDQLYDAIVGRVTAIERGLGLSDGGFANRPTSWFKINLPFTKWGWDIGHRNAVAMIYGTTISVWLFGIFAWFFEHFRQFFLCLDLIEPIAVEDPSMWISLSALIAAPLVTWAGAKRIKRQEDETRKQMRNAARLAAERAFNLALLQDPKFNLALRQEPKNIDWRSVLNDGNFRKRCSEIGTVHEYKVEGRADFYAGLDEQSLKYYMLESSVEFSASQLIALLTDLPANWIFDCLTDRRGEIAYERDKTADEQRKVQEKQTQNANRRQHLKKYLRPWCLLTGRIPRCQKTQGGQ